MIGVLLTGELKDATTTATTDVPLGHLAPALQHHASRSHMHQITTTDPWDEDQYKLKMAYQMYTLAVKKGVTERHTMEKVETLNQ